VGILAQAAYDAAAVFCNEQDFGEPADHTAADGTRTRVSSVWTPVQLNDLGQGFVADAVSVTVPRIAVRKIVRGDVLTRYPDAIDTLLLQDGWALLLEDGTEAGLETSAASAWEVETVQDYPATWQLTCLHQVRPSPRGRA
jgi:hypothetical protein